MMKRKIRFAPILSSLLAIMMCCVIIAAGSFALFSDEVTVSTHLRAGTLDIKLERTGLIKNEPDGDGYLKKAVLTDAAYYDYSVASDAEPNIFGIDDTALLIPGCYYETELRLSNESDAAFAWWLEIILKNPSETQVSQEDLASQLLITVTDKTSDDPQAQSLITDGAASGEALLSNGTIRVGSEQTPAGIMTTGGASQTFFVRVTFKDLAPSENNKAQGGSVWFDLSLHAIQVTSPVGD